MGTLTGALLSLSTIRQLPRGNRPGVQRGAALEVRSSRVHREYEQASPVYASVPAALRGAQRDGSISPPTFAVLGAAPVPGRPTRDPATTAFLGAVGGRAFRAFAAFIGLVGDVPARAPRAPAVAGPPAAGIPARPTL